VVWAVGGSPGGTVDNQGKYTAPVVTRNSVAVVDAFSVKSPLQFGAAVVSVVAPGVVSATANVQVAQYTIGVPDGLSVAVQFGPDTNYGLTTWAIPAPSGGGPVSILVAGMRSNTEYHMRAVFQAGANATPVFADTDHTFTTGSYSPATIPSITAATTPGERPQ